MGLHDTIIAPATAPYPSAIHLIRVSGPEAIAITEKIFRGNKPILSAPSRKLLLGTIVDAEGSSIDQVLVAKFIAPHSYTGEDMIEVSCHGSLYIVNEIIKRYLDLGARMARRGEFTLRAFLNGKMDLSQAEAVADLIAAENKISHQIAFQQMRGTLSKKIEILREKLIQLASLLELELDFAEEDVEFAERTTLQTLLEEVNEHIEKLIISSHYHDWLRKGFPVAIVGRPNAGKSTLLNALLQEERAIVTPIAGTTRDTIEETIQIADFSIRIIDTAGIRETWDEIEKIGIKRTFEKIKTAFLIIYLFDLSHYTMDVVMADLDFLKKENPDAVILTVANKADLITDLPSLSLPPISDLVVISAQRHADIENLKGIIESKLKAVLPPREEIFFINQRQSEVLLKAHKALKKTKESLNNNLSKELIAADLREVSTYLSEIAGKISSEDLLKNIFQHFCIGK